MDRRDFLRLSAASLAGFGLSGALPSQALARCRKNDAYNIIILGDTHFDTEPAEVYHSHYNEPTEWLNRIQRAEFARNGEMWRERCPCLVDKDTRQILQMGDLIQGDCGSGEVHRKMLDDVMNSFKSAFGNTLPLVTVVGNHDIRGTDAQAVYHNYMPQRMSQELGQSITKTTFAYWIGPDAFIVIDFNHPDDEELEKLLQETRRARHTFIVVHGPVFPYDAASCRWFFHGSEKDTEQRRHFRKLFAERDGGVRIRPEVHAVLVAAVEELAVRVERPAHVLGDENRLAALRAHLLHEQADVVAECGLVVGETLLKVERRVPLLVVAAELDEDVVAWLDRLDDLGP